jgi:predicted RNA binding protein YcfA (HicA-like mRNA interferase family)
MPACFFIRSVRRPVRYQHGDEQEEEARKDGDDGNPRFDGLVLQVPLGLVVDLVVPDVPVHDLGWRVVTQKGSHVQLKHSERGSRVTLPVHSGKTIGPSLLGSLLPQAGVSREQLRAA